jgi:hypothetical protein
VALLFNTRAMKAIIKVCTASKNFTEDQKQILKRISMVLIEHGLSVDVRIQQKKYKKLTLKAI